MPTRVTVEARAIELASGAAEARNAWSRFRGLMLRRPLDAGEGLIIEPCGSIHMMFMRFAIDAVFYNRDLKVTRVAQGVKPWTGLALGGKGARGVIELPVGAAADVKPGDQLAFLR